IVHGLHRSRALTEVLPVTARRRALLALVLRAERAVAVDVLGGLGELHERELADLHSVVDRDQIGRAHVCTPVTSLSRMPSSRLNTCTFTKSTLFPYTTLFRSIVHGLHRSRALTEVLPVTARRRALLALVLRAERAVAVDVLGGLGELHERELADLHPVVDRD